MDFTTVKIPSDPELVALEKSMARAATEGSPRGFAYRMLNRFKTKNGKRYQLHATRGWKCIGSAKGATNG